MPKPYDFGKVGIDVGLGTVAEQEPIEIGSERPFRILVLGDFCGRQNRKLNESGAALAARKPVLVDRDNFDSVLARFAPEIQLPVSAEDGPRFPVRFRELDDFHPDRLFDRVDLFKALRAQRKRLSDPDSYREEAEIMQSWVAPREEPPSRGVSGGDVSSLLSGSLLEDAMAATEARGSPERVRPAMDEWTRFIRDIVSPHLVPRPDPKQAEMLAQLDEAVGEKMRAVLHHPDFQKLEAVWRSLFFLVRGLETGESLKIFIADITEEELSGDLMNAGDLRETAAWRLMVGRDWSVIAGDYHFGYGNLGLLGRLALIAGQAQTPFLAGAAAELLGCRSFAESPDPDDWDAPPPEEPRQMWEAIRRFPEACYIGLALPRFLLRMPYSEESGAAEMFEFNEMPGPPRHESYLWGNAALAAACLLGESFSRDGWDLRPGTVRHVQQLPMHLYKDSYGDTVIKPCAEIYMTDESVERIIDAGLMPLITIKDTGTALLGRFQSIAHPPAPLAGRWSA